LEAKSRPTVSVFMIAHNHERYINQAIESVISQKTNFPFLLLIGDDNSVDNTVNICNTYLTKHPEIIKLFTSNENLGVSNNALRIYQECFLSGAKYLVFLEGDDYWTDPFKLQKQVDFLESNPDYAFVATDIIIIDTEGNIMLDNDMIQRQRSFHKSDISFFDLLQSNLINTLTVCVRTSVMSELVKDIKDRNLTFFIDKWFWLHIAMDQKIKFINEQSAAYRIHSGGISHNSDYMDRRTPLIRYDVIKKYVHKHDLSTLNKTDLTILSKSCINLLLFKNLTLKKKLDILWLLFAHPVLLKNSLTFIVESIRKKITRI
jgi:glycosyltransferase involved in cell wall biosynthesis